ncbi:hypothetical protein ACCO45_001300 [Purpureocillium lilacinum]|uniref:Uncharacterized protein n=1 Tax=Purpureocillium lilacinum TaxID=33203 RepID=A0ACC4E766_PURLI
MPPARPAAAAGGTWQAAASQLSSISSSFFRNHYRRLGSSGVPFSVPFISRWQYPAGRLSGYPRRSSRLVEAKRNQGSRGAPTKSIHPKQQEHTRAEQRAQHPHQHQQFSISNRRKTSPALPEPRPVKKSSLRVCRGPPDDARPDRETGKGSRGRAQRQRDGSRKKNINYIISLRQGRNLAVRPRPAATKGSSSSASVILHSSTPSLPPRGAASIPTSNPHHAASASAAAVIAHLPLQLPLTSSSPPNIRHLAAFDGPACSEALRETHNLLRRICASRDMRVVASDTSVDCT